MKDESSKAALIDTGPRPFSLQCAQPWDHVPIAPDTSALHHTTPHADVISDILIQVRVAAVTDRLTVNRWLGMPDSRRGTRRVVISVTARR